MNCKINRFGVNFECNVNTFFFKRNLEKLLNILVYASNRRGMVGFPTNRNAQAFSCGRWGLIQDGHVFVVHNVLMFHILCI